MVFRFGLILSALMIAGATAGAAAQSAASAGVTATVRPGKCPVHSRCGKPGSGNTATDAARIEGTGPMEISVLALDIGADADVGPLLVAVRPPDALRAAELDLEVSWDASPAARQKWSPALSRFGVDVPLQLSSAALREVQSQGLWLYGLVPSAQPPHGAYGGLVTVVVEY